MWGSDSNIIFKVTSEAVLEIEFYICFPVEHPYRMFPGWQTDKLTHVQLKSIVRNLSIKSLMEEAIS